MNASLGFMTAFGGMTSHAALVARQMGKVCIVGCDALSFDYHARQMTVDDREGRGRRQGRRLDLDRRLRGRGDQRPRRHDAVGGHPGPHREEPRRRRRRRSTRRYAKLMSWADARAASCACAPTPTSPIRPTAAVAFGAEGIGLCRTEHMFFGEGKIGPMREMIVAETEADRRTALDKLLPLQREDFAGIFRAMKGRPVTIRTLDPPLHEFLPHDEAGVRDLAARHRQDRRGDPRAHRRAQGVEPDARPPRLPPRDHVPRDHRDAGARHLRGGRRRRRARAMQVFPEIMIPLVGTKKELDLQAGGRSQGGRRSLRGDAARRSATSSAR